MRKGPIAATVLLALVPGLTISPTAALAFAARAQGARVGHTIAQGHVGSRSVVVPGRRFVAGHGPVGNRSVVVHPFFPRHFVHRPFFRHVVPFGVFAGPVIAYAPSPLYYEPPTYYEPDSSYAPSVYSPSVSVAPAAPSTPSVIQYPNGRYELRGDGITTPYTWVWIPNPPPPPPAAPPEDASPGPASSQAARPSRNQPIYHWIDEQGVGHWTDNRDAVPPRYREKARRPLPS